MCPRTFNVEVFNNYVIVWTASCSTFGSNYTSSLTSSSPLYTITLNNCVPTKPSDSNV